MNLDTGLEKLKDDHQDTLRAAWKVNEQFRTLTDTRVRERMYDKKGNYRQWVKVSIGKQVS